MKDCLKAINYLHRELRRPEERSDWEPSLTERTGPPRQMWRMPRRVETGLVDENGSGRLSPMKLTSRLSSPIVMSRISSGREFRNVASSSSNFENRSMNLYSMSWYMKLTGRGNEKGKFEIVDWIAPKQPYTPRVSKFLIVVSSWSSPSRTRFAALLATFVRGIVDVIGRY